MEKETVPKSMIHEIGRIFTLLFNRVMMYDSDHPFTKQSSAEFLTQIRQGLALCSPLVLTLNRNQFFIADKGLDPRLKTAKMLARFNKAGIESISFSDGLDAEDINGLLTLLSNPSRFPDAESMTSALTQQGIRNVRINHASDPEVAAEEAVIDRQRSDAASSSTADAAEGPMREVSRDGGLDPKGAAELIYLAAEIRKKTGDPAVLSDLLVDYIEQIGSKIALDHSEQASAEDSIHLLQVISGIEAELVRRLRSKDIEPDVLDTVARRLKQRLEAGLKNLQKQLTLHTKRFTETGSEEPTTALTILEESVTEGNELDAILKQVRRKYETRGLNENNYDLITKEITRAIEKQDRRHPKDDHLPGVLNRRSTLYILEKEIARSLRYGSAFSVLMISIIKIIPQAQLPPGSLRRREINQAILEKVIGHVRSTDIIGQLDKHNMLVLMPMTIESESKIAMRRILKLLQNTEFTAGPNRVNVRPAGTITTFDHQRTPTLEKFVQRAETAIFDMVNRLRSIRDRY